jgi:uncharacterized protein
MDLNGSHLINASAQTIWDMLMNPDTLAKITPGITRLELESEGVFKAIADIKMGPVNGKFEGKAEVLDAIAPQSFTLKVVQNSKIGNVAADIRMNLLAVSNNQTELSFEGKADMSGLLARTGNRVMSGVANTLTKQFFDNFQQELAAMQPIVQEVAIGTTPTLEEPITTPIQQAPQSTETAPVGFLQKIIHWFMSLFK